MLRIHRPDVHVYVLSLLSNLLSLGLFYFSSFSLYKEVTQPSLAKRNNNAHHEGEDVFAALFWWKRKNAEKNETPTLMCLWIQKKVRVGWAKPKARSFVFSSNT
jgi:hypothetical protein